jgi:hypothetical protein
MDALSVHKFALSFSLDQSFEACLYQNHLIYAKQQLLSKQLHLYFNGCCCERINSSPKDTSQLLLIGHRIAKTDIASLT